MEFLTEMEQTVARLRAINGVVIEDEQIITQILMSLPSSLKLTFGVAWDSTPQQEKTLKKLTARLIKLEKNLKQSEEEKLSDALVSVKGEQEKLEEAEDHAFPVRDNRKMKQNQDKRRCWECGDDSHIRSKCRVFKRRLEREREMSTTETIKEEGMIHQTEIGTKRTTTETRGTIMETGEMTTETGEMTTETREMTTETGEMITETGESTAIQSRWVMATTRRRGGMQTQELLNT